jgi:hypothetical protein
MSEAEELVTYVFTWHALSDACPKCQNLNGKEWHDQDIFQEILWDPIWGNLWNLDLNHSLAHGRKQYNCRCQLEVRVEFHPEEIKELNTLQDLMRLFF